MKIARRPRLQRKSAPCCAPKKPCVRRRHCAIFPPENARIRCKFSARSTRSAPKLRPALLRCCRISASSCWRVQCRKRAHPAIEFAQNFAKNLKMHERRTKLLQVFHDFDARRTKFCGFFCRDFDLKLARRRRTSNASRRRVARRKNRAFGTAIAQNVR